MMSWHRGLQEVVLKFFMGVKRILDSVVSNLIKAIFIILNGAVKTFLPSPTTYSTNTKVNFKEVCLLTLSSGTRGFILKGNITSAHPPPPMASSPMSTLPPPLRSPAVAYNPQGPSPSSFWAFPAGGRGSTSQCIQSCQGLVFITSFPGEIQTTFIDIFNSVPRLGHLPL